MSGRVLVFGDIHGKLGLLQELLARVQPTADDELIFLGDYIDRGQGSWGVLKTVYRLARQLPKVVCLWGNHEELLFDRFDGRSDLAALLQADPLPYYQGDNGIVQLQKAAAREPELVAEVLAWLAQLPVHYERDGVHFSHAGCNPAVPWEEQTDGDFLWPREDFYEAYRGSALWLIGHTPVQNLPESGGRPYPLTRPNNVIMLDTGAFLRGGRLSCLELKSGTVYQAGNK